MPLHAEELPYFVGFVLLDEALRQPSGKRQTKPLVGFWSQRSGPIGLRLSDMRQRHKVCMTALQRVGGRTPGDAASEVVEIQNLKASRIDSVRTSFHDGPAVDDGYGGFYRDFLHWREWVLNSPAATLRVALQHYGKAYGRHRQQRLTKLVRELRQDTDQAKLHRSWMLTAAEDSLERIRSVHKLPTGWFLYASDLWHAGNVYAAAQHPDARGYFERALEIWETHGCEWPAVERDETVSLLCAEIAKLRVDRPS